MASDPVLIHASNAVAAADRYGVPASVILGLLHVEGGTAADGSPVAPGDGAGPPSYGQFTYGTGAQLGVKYGDSASETNAIARYLVQLGYKTDPTRALARYNGGGNPPASSWTYASKVESAAKSLYAGFDHGATAPSSSPDVNASVGASAATSSAPSSSSSSSSSGLIDAGQHSTLVRFGVSAALVMAAVVAIAAGLARSTGVGQSIKLPTPAAS